LPPLNPDFNKFSISLISVLKRSIEPKLTI